MATKTGKTLQTAKFINFAPWNTILTLYLGIKNNILPTGLEINETLTLLKSLNLQVIAQLTLVPSKPNVVDWSLKHLYNVRLATT